MRWLPIETAPKDRDVLVWYDHQADPYEHPYEPGKLTDYAAWADAGDFLDGKGVCVAKWFPQQWEATDEYGGGYWLPECWFSDHSGDYEFAVNATHWMPYPEPPEVAQ